MARWFKWFPEGKRSMEDDAQTDCPSITNWQFFDCNRVHITWQRQMNDSVQDERGVTYTENNNTPHFNRISDEEKDCGTVSSTHTVSHAKTTAYGTVSETFDSLRKGRNYVFQWIIDIDETLVCDFKLELKSQSEVWKGNVICHFLFIFLLCNFLISQWLDSSYLPHRYHPSCLQFKLISQFPIPTPTFSHFPLSFMENWGNKNHSQNLIQSG